MNKNQKFKVGDKVITLGKANYDKGSHRLKPL